MPRKGMNPLDKQKCIQFPLSMLEEAYDRLRELGFVTFAGYIRYLLQVDLETKPKLNAKGTHKK